jgi:hypothetical protein
MGVWYAARLMTAEPAALQRVLSRTVLRTRVQRGLELAAVLLTLGASTLSLLGRGAPTAWLVVTASVGLLLTLSWPVRLDALAARLDRVGGLEGRLQAALSLRRVPAAEQSPFMAAVLRDADRHASAELPARAAPLTWPRAGSAAVLALTALLLVSVWPQDELRPTRATAARPIQPEPPLLAADELLALRPEPARDDLTPALPGALDAYQELLHELGSGALRGEQAVARALALEASLATEGELELASLQTWAEALARGQPKLARALRDDLAAAADELRALGGGLRDQSLDPAARRQLAEALTAARKREAARRADEEREASLLAARQHEAGSEPSLLARPPPRQLESLRRNAPQAASRSLAALSRELSRAGEALRQDQDQAAAEALQQGAEQLDELARQQQDQTEQRALAETVAQLRELLQRRAQQQQQTRTPQTEPRKGGAPDPTTDSEGRRERFVERARGQASDGGSERGRSASVTATTGPAQPGQGAPRIEQTFQSSDPGSQHDSTKSPTPSRARSGYQDQVLRGVALAGPSRSQLIHAAAGSGFADVRYRKVYGDYRAHAEAVLARDQVPPGQRFHVRRYFELVRPREGQVPYDR